MRVSGVTLVGRLFGNFLPLSDLVIGSSDSYWGTLITADSGGMEVCLTTSGDLSTAPHSLVYTEDSGNLATRIATKSARVRFLLGILNGKDCACV